jgi:hypothetical protein
MSLDFLGEAANAVLRGPNGIGKTMIAQNVAHQAVIQGHTAIFTSAGQLFSELAAIDSAIALKYRILIRSCEGRKDYTGGPNHFAPLSLLDDVPQLAHRCRAVIKHGKQPWIIAQGVRS